VKDSLLALLFDISLKVRILRAWQSAHASATAKFDERQLLTLELLSSFGSQTEASIANTLGMASSSATEMTKKLGEVGVVEVKNHPTDKRSRVLELTEEGQKVLAEIKRVSGTRFDYLFGDLEDTQVQMLESMLKNVLKAAEKRLKIDVFNQYE
jgi:DNA-binding MarR family transcriptional regulator